jgi:hypothetical protein
MARRRTKRHHVAKKHTSRRRHSRSVGALKSGVVMDAVGLVAGAVASRFITNLIGKSVELVGSSPTNKAFTQIALGLVTPMISKSPFVKSMSHGMIAGGGYELFKSFAPATLGADDDVLVISGTELNEINGIDQIGTNELSEINGLDEIGYMY